MSCAVLKNLGKGLLLWGRSYIINPILSLVLTLCIVSFYLPDTQENANRIAQAVSVEYESLGRPIVTTEDAIRSNSYVDNVEPSVVKVGDAKGETK